LANPALDQLQIAASVQRPDIKLAALGADLARDKAKIAHASFWPTIGFQGSYDVNHGTSTGLGNQYLLAVRLQFNIFDAGAKSAALKRARAEQDAAEKGSQQVQQRVQLQVQSAYDRQRMAREQYLVAKQAVGWAEEGLRIMQNRHEAGLATVTDMLSAQNAWNQSRLSALQALFQYYVEFASMELAAGTLTTQSTIIAK
jgi:outer membrane protein TolC